MPIEIHRLAKLIETQGATLQVWVRSCCEASEDVVQEAFSRLAVQEPAPDNPVAWLFRVSRNLALKQRLSDQRRRKREVAVARSDLSLVPTDPLEVADLVTAVEGLSCELREVLIARIWGQLSLEEIGQLCGISAPTAYRRYTEAIETLRSKLEPKCENRP